MRSISSGQFVDAVTLTQELVRIRTVNPPGNERACARYLGNLLEGAGFSVAYDEFADQRTSLIARLGGRADRLPICITGHIDTVPLGVASWSTDAFAGEVSELKLYGRGSSDMKAGVAAFVTAALDHAKYLHSSPGLVLIITAAEETGCLGSKHLEPQRDLLGRVGAIVVGEPTANYPVVGHKGSIKCYAHTTGIAAHGAMPERGVNAIYKAARAVTRLEMLDFSENEHPVMGRATLNVGTIAGGLSVNSVPDRAEFGIDIRTIPGLANDALLERIKNCLGDDVELATYQNEAAVWTEPRDLWIQSIYDLVTPILGERPRPVTASYFTDAASLRRAFDFPPTVILGPGEPDMAHKVDEFCHIRRIEEAVQIYSHIIRSWCQI